MYDMQMFEQFVKSNLSAEEIYRNIKELNPIETKEKYSNDVDEPFAIYVGGIGQDNLVTVNNMIYPIMMRFDSEQVYIDFINLVREKMAISDKPFDVIVMSTIRNLSRNWFNNQNSENAKNNAKLAKLYMEEFKSPARQRDGYAGDERVCTFDEENGQSVYNISKFEGTGALAKCVEVNSVACNLLALVGFRVVLAQGYFVNYEGKKEAHTFPLYKVEGGNYCLLDCMLKQQKKDVLPGDYDFSNGLDIEYPVTIRYTDGRVLDGTLAYKVAPQKLIRETMKVNK